MAMHTGTPGTLIHGTLRTADLIPAFAQELATLCQERGCPAWREHQALCTEAQTFGAHADDYEPFNAADTAQSWFDTDRAADVLDALFDALQAHAPDGHYFGSLDGDGADFGFWATDDADDYTQCEACGEPYPVPDADRSRDGDACAFCSRRLP